jgi:hypothetical protein
VALGCVVLGHVSWAQEVSLDVIPNTVAAFPWYPAVEARVVLKNPTNGALVKPALSSFTNDGFHIEVEPPPADRVEAHSSLPWTVRVRSANGAFAPGTIQFIATYLPELAQNSQPVSAQQTFANLTVTSKMEGAQTRPIDLSLEGSFDSIAEYRPGVGYLLATNNLDVPVTVTSVRAITTESIDPKSLDEISKIAPFSVPPHSSVYKPIEVDAAGAVAPGQSLLLLDILSEWTSNGHQEARRAIVTKPVTTGVFFESDVLKVLGLPSFLLLPGALFLFTMQLLRSIGTLGLRNDSRLPQLSVTDPGFWVVAITYSGLFAWVYQLGTHTNYLARYGLRELRNVWLWSIGLGTVTYFLGGALYIRTRSARVPTTRDDPIEILRKMSKQGLQSVIVSPATFSLNSTKYRGFPVERIEEDQSLLWVAPQIVARWSDTDDARTAARCFEEQQNSRARPEQLATTLEGARKQGLVEVGWTGAQTLPNPYHIRTDTISSFEEKVSMVTVA